MLHERSAERASPAAWLVILQGLQVGAELVTRGAVVACQQGREFQLHPTNPNKNICKKSLDFQGPPLTMALVMDVARIKIIKSRAI